MEHHDIVIIGAGPAGLMAARELAGKADFVLLDSKKKIGIPLKCGEGVRKDGFLELFKKADYPFIKNDTAKLEFRIGKSRKIVRADYLLLDRPAFEQWLAAPIENKIHLSTSCKDIVKKSDFLEVITDKGKISARLVILAHGCDYRIQKKFGLLKNSPMVVPCYGGIFTGQDFKTDRLYFILDDPTSSALWLFPKDSRTANVGIGAYIPLQKRGIKSIFSEVLKKNRISLKQKDDFAGVFPTDGPIRKTYADRLLVCGNAAGQIFAGSGEGIYFSLKAGQLAGRTALAAVKNGAFSADFLKRYEKAWKKSFGAKLDASLVFTRILFLGMKYRKLERICSIPTEKELQELFMNGKIPWRARVADIIARVERFFSRV